MVRFCAATSFASVVRIGSLHHRCSEPRKVEREVILLRSFLRTSFVLVFALFSILATPLLAQDATTHAPTITVNARLVVLDVVVTGKDGKPIGGLTQKDFKIFEDDELQTIRSFEPPSTHAEPVPSASGPATTLDPAKPESFGQAPITILVLDQLNTHFADSSYARRELHDYLSKQPQVLPHPTTLLTVFDNNFRQLQGFTRDRDALVRSLEAAPTKYAWKLEQNGKTEYGPAERLEQSLRALQQIAQSYARIPVRKNLIWVGGGFPTLDPTTIDGKDAQEVKDDLQNLTNLLLDTRIALYAVDPTSSAPGMTEITDSTQLEFAEAAGDALAGAFDPFGATDDFDKLGPVTGGRIIRGMNNIADQIGHSIDLGSNYYTISYQPTSTSQAEGKYRKIRVVCLVPGLTAAARNGYYTENPQREKSNDTLSFDLATAAESAVPLNALHVTVEPNHSVASEEESYIVHVGASELTWEPAADGGASAHVAVMAVSLSHQGKMISHSLHGMTANARAGVNLRDSTRTADFSFTVRPASKAATLRFVVRDAATGRMGSFDLVLTRPESR